MAQKVKRTRNAETWTEASYFAAIRSALRQKFRYWKPATNCLNAAKRPSKAANKRLKWEFSCAKCKGWFARKEVQIDHVVPCGSLKSLKDIPAFVKRLTPESEDAFTILCKGCHQTKTNKEREARK